MVGSAGIGLHLKGGASRQGYGHQRAQEEELGKKVSLKGKYFINIQSILKVLGDNLRIKF